MTTATETIKHGDYRDIFQQIGGNKFLTMTGSKVLHYGYDENGYVCLTFKLTRNLIGAQFLKIQYNWKDLYNMEFSKIKKTQIPEYKAVGMKIYNEEKIIIELVEDMWADQLQPIFTDKTHLYTKLY